MAVNPIVGAVDARVSGSGAGSLSRNGEFFTTGFTSVRGGNYVLKINPDYTWEERAVNNSSPASMNAVINGAAISNDGLHVVNVTYDGRRPWILKWNGTEYGFLYELPTLLSGRPTCADYSEDQQFLAVGYWFSVDIYLRTGDTYTFLDRVPPGNVNTQQIESVRWSHDGTKFAIGLRSNILVYSWNGTTATLIYNGPGSVNGWGVEWSLDDDYLFSNAFPGTDNGAWVWTVAGNVVTPYIASGSGIAAIRFESPLSPIVIAGQEYMLAVTSTSPYLKAYEKSSGYTSYVDAATLGFTQPSVSVPGNRMGSAFTDDGAQVVVYMTASGASPVMYGYFIDPDEPAEQITAEFNIGGLQSESVLQNPAYEISGQTSIGGLQSNGYIGENPDEPEDVTWTLSPGFILFEGGSIDWSTAPLMPEWLGGLPQIGGLQSSAQLRQRYTLTGQTNIGGLQSSGYANTGYDDIFGETNIGGLQSDGLLNATAIFGETNIGGLQSDGELLVRANIGGQTFIGGLQSEGLLRPTLYAEADFNIGGLQNATYLDATIVFGDINIGGLQSDGELIILPQISGQTNIGGLSVVGVLERVVQIDANMRIGGLQSSGELEVGSKIRRISFTVVHTL